MTSVAFGNGVFVAVAGGGGGTTTHASFSTDNGQTWNAASFFGVGNTLGVAFGNGKFVTVGYGRARYSDDNGVTWLDGITLQTLNDIAFGNNRFVAIGDSVSAISTDGINWVPSQPHNNPQQKAIAFGSDAVTFDCEGYDYPFATALTIKYKAKGTIPAKFKLFDEDGFEITGADLTSPPVINVIFNGFVYGDGITDVVLESVGNSNDGNVAVYNVDSGYWEYRVGTKQFPAAGTYTVEVRSGDNGEYTINPACSETFTRLP